MRIRLNAISMFSTLSTFRSVWTPSAGVHATPSHVRTSRRTATSSADCQSLSTLSGAGNALTTLAASAPARARRAIVRNKSAVAPTTLAASAPARARRAAFDDNPAVVALSSPRRTRGKQSVPEMLRAPPRTLNFVAGGSPSNGRKYLDATYMTFRLGVMNIYEEQPRALISALLCDYEVSKRKGPADPLDIQNEAEVMQAWIEEVLMPVIKGLEEFGIDLRIRLQDTTSRGSRPDGTVTWMGKPVFQIEAKGLAVINKAKGDVCEDAQNPKGTVGLRTISQLNHSMAVTDVIYGCLTNVQRTVFAEREGNDVYVSRDILRDDANVTPLEALAFFLLKACEARLRGLQQQLPLDEPRDVEKSGADGQASSSFWRDLPLLRKWKDGQALPGSGKLSSTKVSGAKMSNGKTRTKAGSAKTGTSDCASV